MRRVLVSSCLLGDPVRYDGTAAPCTHPVLARWRSEGRIVPCCPEVEAGLPVPRPPVELAGGDGASALAGRTRVITRNGTDLTDHFLTGAKRAVDLCLKMGIQVAVLKDGSPSCGSSAIHDGSFSGTRVRGRGVAAEALERTGIRVFSEQEWDDAQACLLNLEENRPVMPPPFFHRMA